MDELTMWVNKLCNHFDLDPYEVIAGLVVFGSILVSMFAIFIMVA